MRDKEKLLGFETKLKFIFSHSAPRNPSFRNYADYMLTPPFNAGIMRLIALAEDARNAIMCAESVYFRCHRMLVPDYLAAHGHAVLHITGAESPRPHKMMAEARWEGGWLLYREPQISL